MIRPLHLTGAQVWNGEQIRERDIFISSAGRITVEKPAGALTVDLSGGTLFPGLVNAHDHLELNHYPRTKFREVYDNAHQWGEDMNARLDSDPFKTLRRYPLKDRLFIGGLKNLLCGATTVIHHGTKYKPMFTSDFPVRVLKNYGWAHSLHFDSAEDIVQSYRSTPKHHPWFIHLAEGTDEVAASEYQRLKDLGCVGSNTVIVHGINLDLDELERDFNSKQPCRGIVVCPSTNKFLMNSMLNVSGLNITPDDLPVAIGSDSRLTADGDLLNEFSIFSDATGINMSTPMMQNLIRNSRQIVGLPVTHWLDAGTPADLTITKTSLLPHRRNEIKLIMRDGIPRIGDPHLMAKFPHIETVAATLDGIDKKIHIQLAKQVQRCTLKETGLEVDALPLHKRFWFF